MNDNKLLELVNHHEKASELLVNLKTHSFGVMDKTVEGNSVLHILAVSDRVYEETASSYLQELLDAGADPNVQNSEGSLVISYFMTDKNLLTTLVNHDAFQPSCVDVSSNNALHIIARSSRDNYLCDLSLIQSLIEKRNADVKPIRNTRGQTFLQLLGDQFVFVIFQTGIRNGIEEIDRLIDGLDKFLKSCKESCDIAEFWMSVFYSKNLSLLSSYQDTVLKLLNIYL